eukprot:750827-Hanusia_phi.AAC.2
MQLCVSLPSCPIAKKGNAESALEAAKMLAVRGDEEGAYQCYWVAAEWREECDPRLWEMAASMAAKLDSNGQKRGGACYQLGRAASCHVGSLDLRQTRHSAHAECYKKLGDMAGAARALRAVLSDPMVMEHGRDFCLHAANQIAELAMSGAVPWQFAEESFEKLHEGWAGNAHSLRSFALIKTQVGSIEHAVELFDQSLALLSDPYTHSQAFVACNQLKRFDKALEHARACVRSEPGNAEYLKNLGSALVKLGKFEEALPYLLRAQKFEPADPSVHVEIGFAHMGVGKLQEAAEMIERGAVGDGRRKWR